LAFNSTSSSADIVVLFLSMDDSDKEERNISTSSCNIFIFFKSEI